MGIWESASWTGVILTLGVIAYHFGLLEDLVDPDTFAARFNSLKTNMDLFSQIEAIKPGIEMQKHGPILNSHNACSFNPNETQLIPPHTNIPDVNLHAIAIPSSSWTLILSCLTVGVLVSSMVYYICVHIRTRTFKTTRSANFFHR